MSAFRETRDRWIFRKAEDPHDFKYPVALDDDIAWCDSAWTRPLLAASVHVLHGPNSDDRASLRQAYEALGG